MQNGSTGAESARQTAAVRNRSAGRKTSDSHRDVTGKDKIQIRPQNRARKIGDRTSVNQETGDGICEDRDEECNDELSRTVQIVNVRRDLQEDIELTVEHKRSGGGDYEKSEYDSKRRNLTVVFTDAKGLRNTPVLFRF